MKKFVILFLLAFLNFSISFAETIKEIKVEGNERVSKETIILFSGVDTKKVYNSNSLNEVLKNIYSSNFFEQVKLNLIDQTLIISVKEYPIVQNIIYEGIKKKSLLEKLKEETKLKEKNSFDKNILKSDLNIIENILRQSGYYFTVIKSEIVENKNNTIDLIIDVNLGKKAYIKKIKFIGDKKIKDRKLKSVIVSEETKFWKIISNKKFLDVKRIKLDENLLRNYYKNKGYFKVKIESSSAQIIDDKDFELIFKIDAGQKYFFNELSLNLPNDYTADDFQSIINLFSDLKGEIYSLNKIKKILKKIDIIAARKSYEFLDAKFRENVVDSNKINFTLTIEEGEKFYVDQINIFGNFVTEEKVIRNSMIVDEGDAFNKILYNKSINNIRGKDIFQIVKSEVLDSQKDKFKIINIEVEEKPTGEIFAGAGTGTDGSNIGFGIKEKNYAGKGINLDADLTLSETEVRGKFSVNNPNFRNSDKSVKALVESTSTDNMEKFGYKSNRTGFSFGSTFEQYEDVYFSPDISVYYETVKTSSSASDAKKKQKGSYVETTFKYGLTLNKLNQNFQPSDGYKSAFYQTIPLYSEDYALQNTYKYDQYFSIIEDMIFSYSIFGTAINSLTGDDVRITKRVNIPSRRLRGFANGKIGPIDGGDYIGGNYAASVNVKTSLPQLFPNFQTIDFNIFYDAANLWGVDYDSTLDNNKIRSSTGLALDWFTPIGPLTMSYSLPLTKADSDKTESFRFNIGTSF